MSLKCAFKVTTGVPFDILTMLEAAAVQARCTQAEIHRDILTNYFLHTSHVERVAKDRANAMQAQQTPQGEAGVTK
jgi:hypothetical protein